MKIWKKGKIYWTHLEEKKKMTNSYTNRKRLSITRKTTIKTP